MVSIVSYNNYGGDSKLCFLQILIFLVRRPVAISVATVLKMPEQPTND